MYVRRVLVDLTEDRRIVLQGLDALAEETRRLDRHFGGEGDLGAGEYADRDIAILCGREAARPGTEVSRGELVSNCCRT